MSTCDICGTEVNHLVPYKIKPITLNPQGGSFVIYVCSECSHAITFDQLS